MDRETHEYYESRAAEVADRYLSVQSPLGPQFATSFRPGSRVIDVGAGAGRDLARLLCDGYDAWGIEPSAGLRTIAIARNPGIRGRLLPGSLPRGLPDLPSMGGPFEGAVCSAVLQHLPLGDLPEAVLAIGRLLGPTGRMLVSIPAAHGQIGPDLRDLGGRLYTGVTAGEIASLLERAGFGPLFRLHTDDAYGRQGHSWVTLLHARPGRSVV